jgi:predicted secreted protein
MAYTISSAFAIYFVLWWIVLFVTLPFGVRSQSEDGAAIPGSEPGAPIAPLLLRKMLWTTGLSALIFAVGTWGYYAGVFNLDRIMRLLGVPL